MTCPSVPSVSQQVVTKWSPDLSAVIMRRTEQKLTKRVVDAARPAADRYTIWDAQVPGFGLRITSAGTKTFILRYRPKGKLAAKRYVTLGRFGLITVEEARDQAKRKLGAVANGEDPARQAAALWAVPILEEVAADFLSEHVELKRKPKTASSYRHALYHHVVPRLGRRRLNDITKLDISSLHDSLSSTPYMANYVTTVLSSLYSWAGRRGLVGEDFNPARRIDKFRESRRERFLSRDEFARLGAALREAETIGIPYDVDAWRPTVKHAAKPENRRVVVGPDVAAAIRLLMLTGCRLREVLNLRWQEVDLERGLLLLADSKSGRKTVVLGEAAAETLGRLLRVGDYVFPGADGSKPRSDLKRPWFMITRRASLVGLRIHDLRHSYASVAAGAGLGLPIIGKLLGHTQPSTTARYAHLGDYPLRVASNAIAAEIASALDIN